ARRDDKERDDGNDRDSPWLHRALVSSRAWYRRSKTAPWHAFATVFGIVSRKTTRRLAPDRRRNARDFCLRIVRFRRVGAQPRFVVPKSRMRRARTRTA